MLKITTRDVIAVWAMWKGAGLIFILKVFLMPSRGVIENEGWMCLENDSINNR